MKKNQKYLKAVFAVVLFCLLMIPVQASAQSVAGRDYNIFVYSNTDLFQDVSTKVRFESNGALLIDVFDGFGAYAAMSYVFAGFFMAPEFDKDDIDKYSSRDPRDLFLVLSGVSLGDFIGCTGAAFIDFELTEAFFFYGYSN